jgi:hypothetical protein
MSSIDVGSHQPPHLEISACTSPINHRGQPWYSAYMAALFESDGNRLSERIREAEKLMVARERAIFGQNTMEDERGALDNAFHALRALRFCLKNSALRSSEKNAA